MVPQHPKSKRNHRKENGSAGNDKTAHGVSHDARGSLFPATMVRVLCEHADIDATFVG